MRSGRHKDLRSPQITRTWLYTIEGSYITCYLGSFKSNSYLKLMNWQADQAEKRLAQTGQITVIVQDNHPIHSLPRSRSILESVGKTGSISISSAHIFFRDESY